MGHQLDSGPHTLACLSERLAVTDAIPSQPENSPLQPQAAQPGAQPQAAAAEGLDPKVGGLLSYLLFGWIGGLIMYLTQKHPEVRFHGAQSILVFGPLHAVSILLSFVFPVVGFGTLGLFVLVNAVVSILAFVLWIFLSIKGYSLEHFKMPVVGDMAEQWAAK